MFLFKTSSDFLIEDVTVHFHTNPNISPIEQIKYICVFTVVPRQENASSFTNIGLKSEIMQNRSFHLLKLISFAARVDLKDTQQMYFRDLIDTKYYFGTQT